MSVKCESFGDVLGARWFAGKGRRVAAMSAGDVVAVPVPGGAATAAALVLLDVAYADGGAERYLLPRVGSREAAAGDGLWPALLRALLEAPLPGERGRLELRPGPALSDVPSGERVPATDQTNTLVTLGERLLVKAYRRLEAGPHPEVELLTALAGTAAPVPPFAGSVSYVADDGAETAIALLQGFVPEVEEGWETPIEEVAAVLRSGGDPAPLAARYAEAGRAAGVLHAELVRAFGLRSATREELRRWRADAEAALDEAVAHDAAPCAPTPLDATPSAPPDPAASAPLGLAAAAPAVRALLAAFEHVPLPAVTRVHGDLHYAQYLRTPRGALAIVDFEGDPTRPLAARRADDTPLRDLACLLRSIDHIGSAASRRAGGAAPDRFVAAATGAALAGYGETAPVPVDAALLRALELAKECTELVYAQRVLPEWLYAPQHGLRRLIDQEVM